MPSVLVWSLRKKELSQVNFLSNWTDAHLWGAGILLLVLFGDMCLESWVPQNLTRLLGAFQMPCWSCSIPERSKLALTLAVALTFRASCADRGACFLQTVIGWCPGISERAAFAQISPRLRFISPLPLTPVWQLLSRWGSRQKSLDTAQLSGFKVRARELVTEPPLLGLSTW